MKRTLLIFLGLFIVMQFIRPSHENITSSSKIALKTKPELEQVFKTSCYDCHSNNTTWPWYSEVAPFSWIISSHVKNGRKALNFSTWENYEDEKKQDKLKAIYKKIYTTMPLSSYVSFHKEAELSKAQKEMIREWTKVGN